MNNKKIILLAVFLMLASFIYLAAREIHFADYKTGGQTWFLYFNEARSNDLSFTIENYSQHQNFTWSLYLDNDKIQEDSGEIISGSQKIITPNINLPDIGGKKITVKVTADKDEKDIYKFITGN